MAASHGGLVGSLPPASARNTAAFGAASARHLSEEEDWFFDAEGHESPQDRIARESNDRLLELQEGDQIKTPTYGTRYLPYRYSTVRYLTNPLSLPPFLPLTLLPSLPPSLSPSLSSYSALWARRSQTRSSRYAAERACTVSILSCCPLFCLTFFLAGESTDACFVRRGFFPIQHRTVPGGGYLGGGWGGGVPEGSA